MQISVTDVPVLGTVGPKLGQLVPGFSHVCSPGQAHSLKHDALYEEGSSAHVKVWFVAVSANLLA